MATNGTKAGKARKRNGLDLLLAKRDLDAACQKLVAYPDLLAQVATVRESVMAYHVAREQDISKT